MRLRRRPHVASTPELERLEQLADDTVDLAQQMKATVAELRRQDERGDGSD